MGVDGGHILLSWTTSDGDSYSYRRRLWCVERREELRYSEITRESNIQQKSRPSIATSNGDFKNTGNHDSKVPAALLRPLRCALHWCDELTSSSAFQLLAAPLTAPQHHE